MQATRTCGRSRCSARRAVVFTDPMNSLDGEPIFTPSFCANVPARPTHCKGRSAAHRRAGRFIRLSRRCSAPTSDRRGLVAPLPLRRRGRWCAIALGRARNSAIRQVASHLGPNYSHVTRSMRQLALGSRVVCRGHCGNVQIGPIAIGHLGYVSLSRRRRPGHGALFQSILDLRMIKVLIAGIGGASLGVEIAKSLRLAGGYEIYGCDISPLAFGHYSGHCDGSLVISRSAYVEDVLDACAKFSIDVIVPGGDQPARLLAAARIVSNRAGSSLPATTAHWLDGLPTRPLALNGSRRSGFEFRERCC